MATNKSVSTRKKTARKPAPVAKKTTTKVTTVRAASVRRPAMTRFSFSRAPLMSASVAEFVGTFILAAVFLAVSGQPLFVLFGLVAVVLAVGAVSGAHVNPAVTVGAWATRRVNSARAVSYLVAQTLGAVLALVVMNGFISTAPAPSAEAAQFGQTASELFTAAAVPAGKEWVLLAAELLGMTIFAFAAASALRASRDKLTSALTMGGGLYVGLLIAGTAASYVGATAVLNPAVAASVQALSWELWPLMVYILAPLVGGVLGFALHDLVQNEDEVKV